MHSRIQARFLLSGAVTSMVFVATAIGALALLASSYESLTSLHHEMEGTEKQLRDTARTLRRSQPAESQESLNSARQAVLQTLEKLSPENPELAGLFTEADAHARALLEDLNRYAAEPAPPAQPVMRELSNRMSRFAVMMEEAESSLLEIHDEMHTRGHARLRFILFTGIAAILIIWFSTVFYAIPRFVMRPLLQLVDELSQHKDALLKSERQLRAVYESLPVMISEVDSDGRILYANPEFLKFIRESGATEVGLRLGEAFGCPFASENDAGCGHGSACGACDLRNAIGSCLSAKEPITGFEYTRLLARPGGSRLVTLLGSVAPIDSGEEECTLLCLQDISDRKDLERALQAREARFRSYLEHAPIGVLVAHPDGRMIDLNDSIARDLGYAREELLDLCFSDLIDADSGSGDAITLPVPDAGAHATTELTLRKKDGSPFIAEVHTAALDGNEVLAFLVDLSERHRARSALLKQAKLDSVVAEIAKSMATRNYDTGIAELIITRAQELTNSTAGWVFAESTNAGRLLVYRSGAAPLLLPRDQDAGDPEGLRLTAAGMAWTRIGPLSEPRIDPPPLQEGSARTGEYTLTVPVFHEESWLGQIVLTGNPGGYDTDDLTAIGQIAELFRLYTHGQQIAQALESSRQQFLHAQKMEAVGRLAGGIAHDFNNILGVIMGYTDYVLTRDKAPEGLRDHLYAVREASERGAELTRQLLAFARKETIQPRTLDLNTSVESILKLLRRLAGETISIRWNPAPDRLLVHLDPSQLDQLLANLVVNARDAIAGDGSITVSASFEELDADDTNSLAFPALPGAFAVLTISDTGAGMDAETLNRAFEPFFTTKTDGKGTGLGLATVHGIVHQNGGFVIPSSTPGLGTAFKVYLPRQSGDQMHAGAATQRRMPWPTGSETVLLVDDQEDFREACARMLDILGYHVIMAEDGPDALRTIADRGADVALIITDLVMPGMNGKELWNRLRETRPNLRCLFISGYTADILNESDLLEDGVLFLHKPFSTSTLAERIREVLDGWPETGA